MSLAIAHSDKIVASDVVEGGTNVDIQAALDGLTSGRTAKEKVVLNGVFTLTAQITIPSYTILEIQGSITSATNASGSMITNEDAANTDIEIHGGFLDGNEEAGKQGITMSGVTNLLLRDIRIDDVGVHGLNISGCVNFTLDNNNITNFGDDGISILYSYEGKLINNQITGGALNGTAGGSSGIEIEDGSHDLTVNGNIVIGTSDSDMGGITCILDDSGPSGVYNITLASNVVKSVEGRGIAITNNKTQDAITNVVGNGTLVTITSNGHGLTSKSTWRVFIDGITGTYAAIEGWYIVTYFDTNTFTLVDSTTGAASTNGTIDYDHQNITVGNNCVDNCDDAGISASGSRNISVSGNSVSRCGVTDDKDGITLNSMKYSQVVGNAVDGSGNFGIVATTSNQVLITGNTVKDSGANGVDAYSIYLSSCTNCTISSNQCIETRSTPFADGIRSLAGGPNYLFGNELNTCKDNGTTKLKSSGTGDLVRDNQGYKSRSSGSTGAIASGATQAHGLESTPTRVSITPKTSAGTLTEWNVAAGSANLTITHNSGSSEEFWWEASFQEE